MGPVRFLKMNRTVGSAPSGMPILSLLWNTPAISGRSSGMPVSSSTTLASVSTLCQLPRVFHMELAESGMNCSRTFWFATTICLSMVSSSASMGKG